MERLEFFRRYHLVAGMGLDLLKKEMEAEPTDLAIITGCSFDYTALGGLSGKYWIAEESEKGKVWVAKNGDLDYEWPESRNVGARLVVDSIYYVDKYLREGKIIGEKDDRIELEYGYYPQELASKEMQEKLEDAYQNDKLSESGNVYTLERFNRKLKTYSEYLYNGRRYIRLGYECNNLNHVIMLSNGMVYNNASDNIWIEVLPIKWLVVKEKNAMITEKILFSGVEYNKDGKYSFFDDSDIGKFVNEYFSKEIEQKVNEKTKIESQRKIITKAQGKTRLQKLNPDKTLEEDREKMTDTELIHNWIESGESVMLRGPSGIGKTERIKELYPDLIYLKLTNNMFPEKVVGSVNLQTGESIPPDFAKTAIMEAATEEERALIQENIQYIYDISDEIYERSKTSDEKIVVLLDELLNVKPAIQGLVYTLVLNRVVEIGRGLKLPANVVVVGTGNQKKYSMVAEEMAEALEKRFDHILDMMPRVGDWLEEYAIPKKLHPTVIGYIMTKYNSTGNSEEIEDMGYFYEEPEVGEENLDEYGMKGRTNDPRGWTAISKMIYNFEERLKAGKYEGMNVEDILKRSLDSKLRKEWSDEFFDFYNILTLTPEEVVAGMGVGYTQADLPTDINQRFAYMTALLTADETQVEECREFIRNYCDPEYLSVYDMYWGGNDPRKMEKMSEIQSMELMHSVEEAGEYAEDALNAYTKIGKGYKEYINKKDKDDTLDFDK